MVLGEGHFPSFAGEYPVVSASFVRKTLFPLRESTVGGKIYFGLQFQRFQSKVGKLHCFGPETRQSVMAVRVCGRGGCSPHGSGEMNQSHPQDLVTSQ
jgi:hypothetical protein